MSQTAHNAELEGRVREWGERNAEVAKLPIGALAEIFRVVATS